MTVDITFNNGNTRHFGQVDWIKYEPGFLVIQETYYTSISIPSDTIAEVRKESRRSF